MSVNIIPSIVNFLFSVRLSNPKVLYLIFPIIALIIFFMIKQFVKFDDRKEEQQYLAEQRRNKKMRVWIAVSRIIIILLILIAIASPYIYKQRTIPGQKNAAILVDNSKSFSIYDSSIAEKIKSKLEKAFPIQLKTMGSELESPIGDSVLSALGQTKNIILLTDGNTNIGRDLNDIALYASSLNATINAIRMEPKDKDASIQVLGPRKTVADVENKYLVKINNPSNLQYNVKVAVDNEEVLNQNTNKEQIVFTQRFAQGTHKIIARISDGDKFKENNIFYKVVEVAPKPKVLFVTKKSSPLSEILEELYIATTQDSVPKDISQYSAVIVNDMYKPEKSDVEKLGDYVIDGNGLVIWGGLNSYDFGDYKDSTFETILPVRIGRGDKKRGDTNIVLLIDISGSTGSSFGDSKAVDFEKAQAVKVLEDLRATDKVGVIAFNAKSFEISPIVKVHEYREILKNQIERLKDGGGTSISQGLEAAIAMLSTTVGSRQIVLISDGQTQRKDEALAMAQLASQRGIQVYTVGVGKKLDEKTMKEIAMFGQGQYLKPSADQKLKIFFDGFAEVEKKGQGFPLGIMNTDHFITEGIELDASVSGYNQVVPKTSAQIMVATSDGLPILTIWRFGLGKVVAITTDDGSQYGGELLSLKNSQILSRAINWAIGDLNRKLPYYVSVKDTFIDKPVEIIIKSVGKEPKEKGFIISKIDKDLYSTEFRPTSNGFHNILGTTIAVNYNSELKNIGTNPMLEQMVVQSGGMMLDPGEYELMKKIVEVSTKRTKTENVYYRWPFLLIALLIFVTEVCIRKWYERKNLYR